MRSGKLSIELPLLWAVLAVMTVAVTPASAQSEKILYNFSDTITPFTGPAGGLVADAAGNLYGTTYSAGSTRNGTAFELSPKAGGGWTETTIYTFSGADGSGPMGSMLLDAAGNLYGTTLGGGAQTYGTVFQLKRDGSGGWTENVLADFDQGSGSPTSGVISDAAGNLYGTTVYNGGYGYGEVFKLTPGANGTWTGQILHSFNYNGTDGVSGNSLVLDAAGNLFGTTSQGGSKDCGGVGCGMVFELSASSGGSWTEKILYSFSDSGTNGIEPEAGLVLDAAGNLYGTTTIGGAGPCHPPYGYYGCGTVYELMPSGSGWTEKTLYNFHGRDGYQPLGLTFDAAGNLLGITENGGNTQSTCTDGWYGCGTVFRLTPQSHGGWTESVLHIFSEAGRFTKDRDGIIPRATLIVDASGNIYGTTSEGGNYGGYLDYDGGTVFEITP
jgi:uncharacterized repeat protein (TIGR03803 family)